jgi:hypothetical protein
MVDFYLAGGTALALQIGHRIPTDLDRFSPTNILQTPQRENIQRGNMSSEEFEPISFRDGLLFTRLLDTDASFIYQHHSLAELAVEYETVKLATPHDIGLLKLATIVSRSAILWISTASEILYP